MDVIHVPLAIGFITNQIFPKSTLTQPSFAPLGVAFRDSLAFFKVPRECPLIKRSNG
jgi:hypothetical protein